MKNFKFPLTYILLYIPFTFFAQLAGNYTIGTASADYTTINDAITDLTNQGISSSVIFNIQDGNYTLSYTNFDSVSGVSASNTITFQSESLNYNNVILNGQQIFNFGSNVQYIHIKHLTLDVSSNFSNIKRAIVINNGANNITIENCKFTGAENVDTSAFNNSSTFRYNTAFIYLWGGNNISITNNIFDINGVAISKNNYNNTLFNLTIQNNIFNDAVTSILLQKVSNLTVENNTFNEAKYRVIDATILSDITTISKNKIFTLNSDLNTNKNAIYLASSVTGSSILMVNNFISVSKQCYVKQFETIEIYNNSFKSDKTATLTIETNPNLLNCNIINNIFYTPLSIPNIAIYNSLTNYVLKNNAYSNEINTVFYATDIYDPSPITYDLNTWQNFSNLDQNSMVVNQVYLSNQDFHTPNALMLNGNGFSLPQVSEDIDGEIRNTTNPDIGADEFIMDYTTFLDLEIVSILAPINSQCEDSNVILSIKNNSSFIINAFEIECTINDFRGNSAIYNQTINPNETITLNVTHFQINKNTLYKKLKFYIKPVNILDNNFQNDYKSITNVFQLGDFPISVEENCGTYLLSIPIIDSTTVLWSTGESTNQITVNQTGSYSVTITDILGCQLTKTITIN